MLPRVARGVLLIALYLAAAEATVRVVARWRPVVRALAEPRLAAGEEATTFEEFRRLFATHFYPFRRLGNFRCNSLGFADVELRRELPPGTRRLIVLGDSFAYGSVPYTHAYLTVAEEALLARAGSAPGVPSPPLELDNLGMPGAGIEHYRRVYELLGRGLAPDVVAVNLYLGNDLRDFQMPGALDLPTWARSRLLILAARTVRLVRGRALLGDALLPAPALDQGGPGGVLVEPDGEYEDDRPPFSTPYFSDDAFADVMRDEGRELFGPGSPGDRHDWDALARALERIVAEVEGDHRRVVLVLSPSRLQVYPEELARVAAANALPPDELDAGAPNRWLASWAGAHRVPLIDETPALRAAAAHGERLYLVNDTHWNLRGNRLAGAELAARLAELGLGVPAQPAS